MLALLLCAASPAAADVVSRAPDAVAVTVYRDHAATAASLRQQSGGASGLAMIAETRSVDLPAGRTRIAFQGVADAIIPASAALTGLPGRLVERNFDYDLLDPGSLIERSVGQGVTLRRTNPRTGKVSEEPATLVSGPDGVVARTSHGVEALGCGAGPQALVFDHLPPGLAAKPTLSVVVDAPRPGHYQLTLSYLAVSIDWSADYVARLSPDGTTLDLTGWLTLSNRSGMSFADAPTSVVAGALARVAPDLPDISPGTVQTECWPMGTTSDIRARMLAHVNMDAVESEPPPPPPAPPPMQVNAPIMMKAEARRVETSSLGDYKLYSLVEPTTVAAMQTKQIRFLHQTGVGFERLYVTRLGAYVGGDLNDTPRPTATVLRFQNQASGGLGLPLPAGMVTVRQPQAIAGGRELYVGEHGLRDVPSGEEFELELGAASDVEAQGRVVSDTSVGSGRARRQRQAIEFALTNARPSPATFELRQSPARRGFKVVTESAPHTLKNGEDVWRVTIPANGTASLSYTFEAE